MQKGQAKYQQVIDVQNQSSTITKELKTLLANDLQWSRMLDTLRSTGATTGVSVQGINAVLDQTTSTSGATATLPSTSKAATVGTVTITGAAPDKPSIAKFVDALSKLKSVANPYLTTATKTENAGDQAWQFSVTVTITSTTLCGRFTTKCKSTGGN
jgi:Tfp pilus assembly protein PilN